MRNLEIYFYCVLEYRVFSNTSNLNSLVFGLLA
jgi:hypothetical protein